MAASDAKYFALKNTALRVTFPIYDNTGALVSGAAGLDSEVSIDGGTFADCTNEATEIATASGMYYLDLTAGELNGDTIAILVKTSTVDAKTTALVIYPVSTANAVLGVNVAAMAANTVTASAVAADAVTEIQSGLATSVEIAALPTATENADALLNRNIDQTGNGSHTVEESLAFLRNKWGVSAGTLTVYESDGTTPLWTGTVPSDPNAQPIIGMIPT